jgi:hypothetical protein
MLNWGNQGWQLPRIGGVPNIREPRTDSERTDQIMRILGAGPGQSLMNDSPGPGPMYVRPDFGRWAEPILGFNGGELVDTSDVGAEAPSPFGGQSMHLASMAAIPAAIPAGLQIGQAGIAALRALGPLAAATLAAILKYFRDTLGRQPTPTELDAALTERAEQKGPAAGVGTQGDAQQRTPTQSETDDPDLKQECEDMFRMEQAKCRGLGRVLGGVVQKVCANSARQRFAECLRFGRDGVRTELSVPPQLR